MNTNPKLTYLRKVRKEHKKNAQDMAKVLNVSLSMYKYIEAGSRKLSYDNAVKLEDYFNMTSDELFYKDFDYYFKDEII